MTVIAELENHILTLRLNRPDVSNAFNNELINTLNGHIENAQDSEDIRAIVLRGNGKHFSAGADLNWMKGMKAVSMEDNVADAKQLADLMFNLAHCRKPVIAIVHGAVMGGGVGLTACADIVIAEQQTFFALSETRLGLSPATISPFVVKALGARQAKRYMLTGERFSAEKALSLGLVHEVVASDEIDETLSTLENHLCAGGPNSHRKIKKLVRDVSTRTIDETLMENLAWRIANQRVSDEGQEGLSAFLEKRKPNWFLN
ncbi:enoyl-CoA hydratase/isomerase family protein [Reinekea marina]|uniref:Enoyl-CoA hydratase/isomerase family protein n=1 Tax=Reinekea marina TaxID=1310421 RepID=A0ABV7WTY4_9GAMM|nr:enoyl-CoA hydratase/isomerase family protein [Reinekea marina]MDN3651042.1 enoyl-CoA hydratase/isomerase family protein [Reinekea marina]